MKKNTILLLFAIICLSACKTNQSTTTQSETTQTITIIGKEWIAIQLGKNAIELAENRLPNLTLSEEGKVSGSASCNRFHGRYTMDGNKISFNPLARTKMFCQETQKIEEQFMNTLSNVKLYEYKDEKLHFFGKDKKTLIIFKEK